jgi:hypothetical protein
MGAAVLHSIKIKNILQRVGFSLCSASRKFPEPGATRDTKNQKSPGFLQGFSHFDERW